MLFIDTCYIIALVNSKARNHSRALYIKDKIKDERMVINSIVLTEMLNNLHKTRYNSVRQQVLDKLYGVDYIHYVSQKDYDVALEMFKNYNFSVNFSDCVILKTMMDYGVNTIVSFDGHFDKIKGIERFY